MSVSRRDLILYLESNGYVFDHEGGNHTVYACGTKKVPVKRHRIFDRITANQICKQAGLKPPF
jgi:mRNA interferase HicA